jgi:hypothetical protein
MKSPPNWGNEAFKPPAIPHERLCDIGGRQFSRRLEAGWNEAWLIMDL